MDPIIAKCGYRCDLCLIHEANLKSEDDKRRMSEALARYYECQLAPEMIRACKGCAEAKEPPDKACQVYPCVREHSLKNCGQCPSSAAISSRPAWTLSRNVSRSTPRSLMEISHSSSGRT